MTRSGSWRPSRTPGLARIDHLITTHFHGDHVGGMSELATHIPIQSSSTMGRTFSQALDTESCCDSPLPGSIWQRPGTRREARRPRRRARGGLAHRDVGRKGSQDAAARSGPSRILCANFSPQDEPVSGGPVGNTEDEQSVGSHVTFGEFRLLYLGDLTWNKEFELMCPNNPLGTVDLFVASRHGNRARIRRCWCMPFSHAWRS